MGFVLIGVLFLALRLGGWVKFSDSDWVAWAIVLAPFGLAVLWWAWADSSGLTQRQAMQSIDDKKAQRREKALEALGQGKASRKGRRG
ncbi:MAG: TIGR04438 family Trp-rich protein [Roseateles depolymerans]|uniref:TIGR04438 family Trp-rich protein n=1 Tax=Roseateles depolymerans TaxID=76731 RepID=A0A2W5E6R2_9BURK|nr:MAG: TIGR04438 family Trp-rich protein [Roseateles depolymerans]